MSTKKTTTANKSRISPSRELTAIEIIDIVKPIIEIVSANSNHNLAAKFPELKDQQNKMALLDVHDIKEIGMKFPQRTITIGAGFNGCGDWSVYFGDLQQLIDMLNEVFENAWVVEMNIDNSDDIFYVRIGIRTGADYKTIELEV